ncbi:geraniol 8-hydroxylase [Amborella trichopoda]|uniref:Cytochrome P450 n=1 Tax=Amborella trichopoda TaxID=13333 RepID=U5DB25_AMBTC|nr:geraniol 8-hydroxylase [Amborella trichopoda]ERN19435.1 hypothetical protein AMTR_s00069p00176890 [Amborella trichopoda]|eukprot:XP_006857968.1 geraniol 8-hydroxylase [Amborella trichopoda]
MEPPARPWLAQPRLEIGHTNALVLVALTLIATIYAIAKRKQRLPPGPRGWPLLGNLPSLDPNLHECFASLSKRHGPLMSLRLGTKLAVVISSPELAREVLKDHDVTFANRDVPAAALRIAYGGSDIVWTPHGPLWRLLRKVCVRELLNSTILDSLYTLRRRQTRATVREMLHKAGTPVNVGAHMFLTALNIITNMLWGKDSGDQDDWAKAVEFRRLVGEITELLGRPNVSDLLPLLRPLDLQGIEKKMGGLFVRFDGIFNEIIEQRMKDGGKEGSHDFLNYLLDLKDKGDPKTPLTMTHIKALLMDMVVGGTDTTSNTVEWAMAHMLEKPEIMKRAQEEVDRVVGTSTTVEESHLSHFVYLDAIVKEVLRLHPALPLLVPHCPSAPCTVGGYNVPTGTRVFINVWSIQRDPAHWDRPLEFDPERFLREPKWDFSGRDFEYFPFGSGRRICAGIAMANRMVNYSVATLLHSFEWCLPEGEKLDMAEKFGIVLKKAVPLLAIPEPRLSDPALYEE